MLLLAGRYEWIQVRQSSRDCVGRSTYAQIEQR
jgi:hypothetical protein